MKHSSIKRLLLLGLLVVIVAMLAACGTNKEENTNKNAEVSAGGSTPTEQPPVTDNEPVEPEKPEAKTEKIKVYYPDNELIELGEQTVEIQYEDDSKRAEAVFLALQKDGAGGEVSLWKGIELLSAKVEDGGAVILDIHIPDEARLGAPGEVLAIEAIQKTFFQFDAFNSLDILVDGKQIESLMGHDILEHPYKK
ncbi:GerMN domain-containing protein [Paenibacillus oenotherae]|uniref:GerMN domain-containing protein n=1 Tax=Paenibacillus oenotherae TaxID=1435645 RepID=A0ABS7D4K6_9BACL|nr:GerMN domain-containing protein [Paenibacillus oenotherae]MBW7474128.1 GerMN domain-containing protein [Paenibacillus oenotherae]